MKTNKMPQNYTITDFDSIDDDIDNGFDLFGFETNTQIIRRAEAPPENVSLQNARIAYENKRNEPGFYDFLADSLNGFDVRVTLPKIGVCHVIEIRHVADPRYKSGIVGKIQDKSGKIRSVRFSTENKIHFVPYVVHADFTRFAMPPIVRELQHKAASADYPNLFPRNRDHKHRPFHPTQWRLDNEIPDFGPLLEEFSE